MLHFDVTIYCDFKNKFETFQMFNALHIYTPCTTVNRSRGTRLGEKLVMVLKRL